MSMLKSKNNILHQGMRIQEEPRVLRYRRNHGFLLVEGENRRFETTRRATTRRTEVRQFATRHASSKGQMFIIASVLVAIALIGIKNLLGVYSTFEESRFEETLNLDKQIRNIKNEFGYLLGVATLKGDVNISGITFFYNFSNFTVNDIDARILYAFVFVNSSTQEYGVTVGNLIKDTINITINATNSTPVGYTLILNSSTNATRQFNSNINGTVNITLTYSLHNENVTERFSILASTRRYAGIFFDIKLSSKDEFVRSKELYNRTW